MTQKTNRKEEASYLALFLFLTVCIILQACFKKEHAEPASIHVIDSDSLKAEDVEIRGDTVEAVIVLIKEYRRTLKQLDAANEVFKYVTYGGTVTDYEAFSKAALKFRVLKDKE